MFHTIPLTYLLASCQYALSVLIPYTVFTNNRFLSPSSSCLRLSFALHCILIVHLDNHTLSLVPLHLCPCLCFTHFDSCVCGIAPLVASAFPFVCVHHTLHPALCLVSLHCMFHLCVFCMSVTFLGRLLPLLV